MCFRALEILEISSTPVSNILRLPVDEPDSRLQIDDFHINDDLVTRRRRRRRRFYRSRAPDLRPFLCLRSDPPPENSSQRRRSVGDRWIDGIDGSDDTHLRAGVSEATSRGNGYT